jgi:glycerol-3-phosphate acyltransferase PlsY
MIWLACILGAYLVGSIPMGVIIGKFKGVDIRKHGSMNIGATNVGRVLGKRLGMLCFALDLLKGALPVLLAGSFTGTLGLAADQLTQLQMWLWLAVATAAVVGHMFSLVLGFRGGKGVATGFGAVMAMWPLLTFPAVAAILVWYITLRLFKYVSLASMLAAVSLPFAYLLSVIPCDAQIRPWSHTLDHLTHASPPFFGTLVIAMLVIYRHRANIGRIWRGEEPKIPRHEA